MFFKKYLNDTNFELLLENYDTHYLETLQEKDFLKIYDLFQKYEIYCLEDIIVCGLEIFQMDVFELNEKLKKLKLQYPSNLGKMIENNLSIILELIENDL